MIKKIAAGALLMVASAATVAAVGVSVSVGQPGFYGQIVLGDAYPAPQLVYPQPVIIQPPAVAVIQQPLYLRVPPGHMKRWSRYCGNYGACGRQVYFVQDNWYQNVYSPRYNESHGHDGDRGDRGRGRDHDRGEGRGRGNGNGDHDHGHGRGRD